MNSSTQAPHNPGVPGPTGDVPQKWQDQLHRYRSEISAAKRKLHEDRRHENWRRFRDIYSKSAKSHDPNVDAISVPVLFANINVTRSALTVNNPKFAINPRNPSSAVGAMACEEVMNYEWYAHDHQDEIRAAVDDQLITGLGWVKVGYNLKTHGEGISIPGLTDTPNNPDGTFTPPPGLEIEGFNTEFEEVIEGARSVASSNPMHLRPSDDRQELARQIREEGAIILEDHPWVERVSPFDMYQDPSATDLKRAQWVAQRVTYRLDAARDNPAWSPRVRKQLAPGQKSLAEHNDGDELRENMDPDIPGNPGGSEVQWTVVWEFYDLHRGLWCQFDDHADDFLIRPEPIPFKTGHPFRMIRNHDVPDEFYPIGEIEMLESLQAELNQTRTALFNDRKQNRSKWIVDKKYLDQDNSEQGLASVLTSSKDNLIASVQRNPQDQLDNIVIPVPSRQLDPELYNNAATSRADINDISGVTEYQRGGGSTGASTATEAAIINDGALARLKEKQGRVEQFMAEVARAMLGLKLQYMSERKRLRIVAGDPRFQEKAAKLGLEVTDPSAELFFTYTRKDIQGEFDLIVVAGSSSAFNETQRKRQATDMLATTLPLFNQGIVNEAAIMEEYFRNGLGISDPAKFMAQQQPAPQQQGGVPYDPASGGALGGAPTQSQGQLAPGGGIPEQAIASPLG